MSEARFGAGTDLITNLTTFPQMRLRAELAEMFRLGPSPAKHLQSFVHEAAHHWCFDSAVGVALSTLGLRTRVDVARLLQEGQTDRAQVLDRLTLTLTRQRVAQAFLGPFMEGFALFAEFDATPRVRTRVRSTVMDQVAHVFGMPVPGATSKDTLVLVGDTPEGIPEIQQEIDKWLLLVLGKSRTSTACIERKANILVHPFEATNGYLPGYLFVKELWLDMARRIPRLMNETDLFLTYLRHHMFADPGIATALLNPTEQDPLDAARSVELAVDMRFEKLLDVEPEMVDEFEAILDTEDFSWDDERFLRSIQVQTADNRQADQLFAELPRGLYIHGTGEDADPMEAAFEALWETAMAGRRFLSMGAMPLTFEVRDQRFVCPDDESLERSVNKAATLWGADHATSEGSAELLILSEGGLPRRLLAFSAADTVLGLAALPLAKTDEMKRWFSLLSTRSAAGHQLIEQGGSLLGMVRSILTAHTVFGEIESGLPDRVMASYLPWTLSKVGDPARRKQLAASMQANGLKDLLRSVTDVRALATLSLSVMTNPMLQFVEADLERHGFDPQAVITQFSELYKERGFPRVQVVDGFVLAVI